MVAIDAVDSGSTIFTRACSGVAPSMIAASSRLSGSAMKKLRMISRFQGLTRKGITIAQKVLVRPMRSTRK